MSDLDLTDPTATTLTDLARAIHAGKLSPVALTRAYLERIARLDGTLRAYITVDRDGALAAAAALEREAAAGAWRGPLHGVPLAHKDLCLIPGLPTSCGTKTADYFVGAPPCTAVARLGSAGALTLGAGIADSVDGAVAVMQGRTSAFGFVWDSTADRLADLAMIAGPVVLVATQAAPGWGAVAVAAGTAAAGLLLLLEYVRARAQAGQVAAAWSLATPGERPTRVIVLGLTGLAVGAAQLGGDGTAQAALDLGYPLALAVLAVLEAAGCIQLLVAVRHAESRVR